MIDPLPGSGLRGLAFPLRLGLRVHHDRGQVARSGRRAKQRLNAKPRAAEIGAAGGMGRNGDGPLTGGMGTVPLQTSTILSGCLGARTALRVVQVASTGGGDRERRKWGRSPYKHRESCTGGMGTVPLQTSTILPGGNGDGPLTNIDNLVRVLGARTAHSSYLHRRAKQRFVSARALLARTAVAPPPIPR